MCKYPRCFQKDPSEAQYRCSCTTFEQLQAAEETLSKTDELISDCQSILTQYLKPDGIDAAEAISQLLGKLDGPQFRETQ